jgi:hypothetical protein
MGVDSAEGEREPMIDVPADGRSTPADGSPTSTGRSFALAFAAVMLRIYTPLSQIAGFDYDDSYA